MTSGHFKNLSSYPPYKLKQLAHTKHTNKKSQHLHSTENSSPHQKKRIITQERSCITIFTIACRYVFTHMVLNLILLTLYAINNKNFHTLLFPPKASPIPCSSLAYPLLIPLTKTRPILHHIPLAKSANKRHTMMYQKKGPFIWYTFSTTCHHILSTFPLHF